MSTLAFNSAILRAKTFASTQISTTSATTVYTSPTNGCAKIGVGSIANVSSSAITVTVSIVPSGSTDDGTHTVYYQFPLGAGDTVPLTLLVNAELGAGDFISVTASASNAADVWISGIEGTVS